MLIRISAWACLAILIWFNCVRADADFLDVRTKLVKSRSGEKEDPADKYFRMRTPVEQDSALKYTDVAYRR